MKKKPIHVRINTVVDACKFPYRGTGNAMLHNFDQHSFLLRKKRKVIYRVGFFRRQPNWSRLLASHHQVDVLIRPQAMRNRTQKAIRIWRQIHPRELWLQIQNGTYKARILMGKSIVFLTRPSGCLDIIDGTKSEILSPTGFASYLDELGVLDHHGVDYPQESFV